MLLENSTPFMAERCAVSDENGADLLVVLMKATYAYDEKGRLAVASPQLPLELADQYYGKPEESSIKYASDFSINKPATDVALIGQAYAPQSRATEVNVSLQVGPLKKALKVFGDRYWQKTLGVTSISSPAPFEKMPLLYERVFGGVDQSHSDPEKHDYERRNPIGVGFRAKKSQLPIDGAKLPNLEDPGNLISGLDDKPTPAGFGFISPTWQPRLGYAGTYDENWQKTRMPLLPADFDKRFFNVAPPDLVYKGFLQGNEPVALTGVSPRGYVRFSLPGITPVCQVVFKNIDAQPVALHLDKIVIDADESQVILLWSGSLKMPGEFHDVEAIKFDLKK